MPKIKTNRAAAKRFRVTKKGKVLRSMAFGRHLMTGKAAKRRRNFRKAKVASAPDTARVVKRLLPYG